MTIILITISIMEMRDALKMIMGRMNIIDLTMEIKDTIIKIMEPMMSMKPMME